MAYVRRKFVDLYSSQGSALGQMPKARPYLENGHLELDNNTVKRSVKPVAIGRNN